MQPYPTFHKTRIAPTPSGFLHVGNVLSFAITAALARKTSARILLRIDDIDRARITPQYVHDIFDTLHYLNIPWNEGPENYTQYEQEYSQLHRMPLYNKALQQLREGGHVFACECSRAQVLAASPDGAYPGTCREKGIPLDKENVSWRLRTDTGKEITFKTLQATNSGMLHTVTATLPANMHDFIVRKKDGFPAYQLTSVVDDDHFGIDLVVRGADLWPSTIAQHYLAALIPGNTFQYSTSYHHPLLLETPDRKLSKSAGATSIQFLRKEGKQPADIYTIIARMLGYEQPVKNFEDLLHLL
ncbi:MAG TPA: glutamate--tRNA ligase family protein [Chitinophaga sp.]|uniref:glutamate--tRNA ligase family protein n=1 Tax=Chitinophaga sp. TaxID=1869181 RepID=UPI002DB5C9D4|nr:glutamate--tRNA ligase family protein [Chitinophaga sp.]HEU4551771.1 glutamate--tRNA ligase family protein [Chitinophaga sp.]